MYIGTNFPYRAEYSITITNIIQKGLDPIQAIAEVGLDYVELAVRRESVNRKDMEADIQKLHAHGLHANFHPYFNCQGFDTTRESATLRERVTTMLELGHLASEGQGRSAVINWHAAAGRTPDKRSDLLQQSHAFHQWMMEAVDELGADVIVTTEHQLPLAPNDSRIRIGDSFAELLTLIEATQHDRFRICWDMGHSTMRYLHHGDDLLPPEEFLPLVRHVHIHDVDFGRTKDHRLIGLGNTPLTDLISGLARINYAGGFTMEYDANEFFDNDYIEFLTTSKANLLDIFEKANQPKIA